MTAESGMRNKRRGSFVPLLPITLLIAGHCFAVFGEDPSGDLVSPAAADRTTESIRALFLDPPARFRILPIVHNIPAEPEKQDAYLASLTRRGFGGVVTNVPFANYLRDEKMWGAFRRFVDAARERGMAMWLYDERGYPSGNAGGLTLEGHPEWEARGLYFADKESAGGPVTFDLPPGTLLRAAAFPVRDGVLDLDNAIDLTKHVADGKLTWTAPVGQWRAMAITEDRLYEATHAEANLYAHIPYINVMLAGPGRHFAKLTYDAYAAHLGDDLGKYFIATFTDEPSLMSMLMRRRPYRILPWSQDFSDVFRSRRGYAIEPLLPALVAPAGSRGARARYDFWLTVAEQVCENFFLPIRTVCRHYNVPSGGHLLLEEPLLTHVPCYGDLLRCEKMLDAPSLDCLTSIPPAVHWYSARLVSSAGELIGRLDNMCETSDHVQRYRPKGDARPPVFVTEEQIRGTLNRLFVSGITCITSYYRFDRFDDETLRRLNQWTGRVCAMLYGGHQAADVAVLYPIESVWPRFEPAHNWTQDCPESTRQIERVYRAVSDALFFHQRDFTYVDAEALAEGKVEDGVLRFRDLAWRAVILPCADTLPLKAWRNLAEFWKSGGTVIAVAALPANSETEFPSPAVRTLAREIFGEVEPDNVCRKTNAQNGTGVFIPANKTSELPSVLNALVKPDVRVAQAGSPIRATHRRIGGHEVYFLINDSDKPWEGDVRLAAEGTGEQYDPATGAITPLDDGEAVRLRLPAYGGLLFRFSEAKTPPHAAISAR